MEKEWYYNRAKEAVDHVRELVPGVGIIIDPAPFTEVSKGSHPYGWVQVWLRIDDPPARKETGDSSGQKD